jgi:hypothetical protein
MIRFRESNIKRALKNIFLTRKKNVVVLEPRAGLGDCLICIGLVKKLAKLNPDKFFYFACIAPKSYLTFFWILNEVHNVCPIPVTGGKEARHLSGFWNCQHLEIGASFVDLRRFDASYYEQLQVPFSYRWEVGQIKPGPRTEELLQTLNPGNENYVLVCNNASSDISFGLQINNPNNWKMIHVNPATNNLCYWVDLMKYAEEIHTIDTSFIHLTESFFYDMDNHPELFFHLARPSGTEFTRKLPWTLVPYDHNAS